MNNEIKDMDLKTKKIPLVKESLLSMPINEPRRVKSKAIKPSVVRAAIARLNAIGYKFETTEAGLVDEIRVTRIK